MKKLVIPYFSNVKNPVSRIACTVLIILVLTLLLMTAGYFTGQALYYFTR